MNTLTGNTFDPNNDIPDLSGKVYVVTGGSAGIGFGICAHILQHNPAKLYLLSNKEEHADEAQEGLKKWGDISKVEWMKCDLSNLKRTDEVAKDLKRKLDRLDALICNAGIGVGKYSETVDGLDSHFQINVLSQIHLALTLLPILQKTPNSRLVVQSSSLHAYAPSDLAFASTTEINQDIGPSYLYNRSKLAQILFIKALVRRMAQGKLGFSTGAGAGGPWMNATHPGAVDTDQPNQAIDAYGTPAMIGYTVLKPFMKDPIGQGCRTALFAATSPDVEKDTLQGQYIVPERKVTTPSSQALDETLQENLWKLSTEILQQKLGNLPYESEL